MESDLNNEANQYADYVGTFTPLVSSVLISRFTLNLRHIYYITTEDIMLNSYHPSLLSTQVQSQAKVAPMRFASRLVGNMGAPLNDQSYSMTTGSVIGDSNWSFEASSDIDSERAVHISRNPFSKGIVSANESIPLRNI
ncbi:hypothetical protein AcW1_005683 [Taiwanofungus camphoratus]|nr:hypothetical protein AcW2_004446 [Antrodia cinnamomea]KAI0934029.1 hypothetical protein AcV5_006010 [Antrodia cinnamomea]KAI0957221.1 hypothetical protein AcW1_005683 [Antrodia cinnamomea]